MPRFDGYQLVRTPIMMPSICIYVPSYWKNTISKSRTCSQALRWYWSFGVNNDSNQELLSCNSATCVRVTTTYNFISSNIRNIIAVAIKATTTTTTITTTITITITITMTTLDCINGSYLLIYWWFSLGRIGASQAWLSDICKGDYII